jgi:hypothetical protein
MPDFGSGIRHSVPAGEALRGAVPGSLFLTAGFAARALFDRIARSHILEKFVFFGGLLLAISGQTDDLGTGRNA